ncbi:Desulfoferrodoxin [Syntrophobacter sp. SbD1]|nr:Desulfoferrodoxin [Syntrophobacter sp. SbD1]
MAQRAQVYKCEKCGNIVEVMHGGPGALVCCAQTMRQFIENATDASKEKHVPVVEKTSDGIKVTVGSIAHPMDDSHFIEWIELTVGDAAYRRYLKPGARPEAVFPVTAGPVTVREYCTLHGLWKS